IYRNLGQIDLAEATFNEALKYVDRMSEREKFRTLGLYYNGVSHNYRKAVETYEALLATYAFYAGDFDKALEQVGLVLKQNDKYQFAFLPLALAQSSKGDIDSARNTY